MQCREVIESMRKAGEVNARLKQMEVALDDAELAKQNAETEAALANEKAALSISEVKRIELMVCISCWPLLCYCSLLCTTLHLSFSFITRIRSMVSFYSFLLAANFKIQMHTAIELHA